MQKGVNLWLTIGRYLWNHIGDYGSAILDFRQERFRGFALQSGQPTRGYISKNLRLQHCLVTYVHVLGSLGVR